MYWPGPFADVVRSAQQLRRDGAGDEVGRWRRPRRRTAGAIETYILLANPGATAATVTLTFLRDGRRAVVEDRTPCRRRAGSTCR